MLTDTKHRAASLRQHGYTCNSRITEQSCVCIVAYSLSNDVIAYDLG